MDSEVLDKVYVTINHCVIHKSLSLPIQTCTLQYCVHMHDSKNYTINDESLVGIKIGKTAWKSVW